MENNRIRLKINDEARGLSRQKPCSPLLLCSCNFAHPNEQTQPRDVHVSTPIPRSGLGFQTLSVGKYAGARLIFRSNYLFFLCFLLPYWGLQSQSLNQRLEAVLVGEKVNADREFSVLTRAKAEEFDETSKSLLLQIVASENIINQADYILLAGFLYGEELLPFVPATARKSAAVRRAINLAKVRAGNEERTANLLKNVARIPLNDDFVYTVTPMLIYTRQRAVLDYLLELVMISNSNCTPGDAETSGRIDCGYRLIEYLAVAIAEFPVAVDEDGDLLDNDYAAALIKVREWIALNKPYYTILTNTY